jgi:tetratricopeptide (TPR) repeat protein
MSEELRSDRVAAPKQGWYARLNGWYRQNKVLYFICLMAFYTALSLFLGGIYDQVLRATLGPALLFGAGAALVIGAAAALIWAILVGRNLLVILAAVAVAASTSLLFFVFAPTSAPYFPDSGKDLMMLRLVMAAPALCASIALLIQALPKRQWWVVMVTATIALLAAASLYMAFVQYQNSVNLDRSLDYSNQAAKYVQAKEYDAAIVVYSDAIRLQPYDDSYYDDQASVYEAKGDYDSAIANYDAIIGFAPSRDYDFTRSRAYASIGSVYSTTLRYNQAITAYSQSISYGVEVSSYASRGDIYLKLGQKDKAIADYQAALAHDGVPTTVGSSGTYWSYLTPADRSRIEQTLKDLGVAPAVATPSPTPHP